VDVFAALTFLLDVAVAEAGGTVSSARPCTSHWGRNLELHGIGFVVMLRDALGSTQESTDSIIAQVLLEGLL